MKIEAKKTHLHLNLSAEAHQNLRIASVVQKITITELITRFALELQPQKLLSKEKNEKSEQRDFAAG